VNPPTVIVGVLVFGSLLVNCQRWLRDPTNNPWPARGLATVLFAFIFALVADLLLPPLKVPLVARIVLIVLPTMAAVGASLAVYGLFRGTPPGGRPGRGRAAWAVVLGAAFVGIFVPNALRAPKSRFPAHTLAAIQSRNEHVDLELNYRLTPPPEPWLVLDGKALNAGQAFGHADAGLVATLTAAKIGPGRFDSRSLAKALESQLQKGSRSSSGIADATLDALPAAEFRMVRVNAETGGDLVVVVRILEIHGYGYTLQVAGPSEQEKAIGDALKDFCNRFSVVDRTKIAGP
jgi:hypothetical protein